ncbi:MAG: 2-hydroxyacyl-CoA dehydratase [Clostridia bacterium]|nr:2-hydroxyacyl-CoA dehydratase [Clostridia bacterium]
MKTYLAGADIGSTTVKLAVLDESGNMVFGRYMRHFANIRDTFKDLLIEAKAVLGDVSLKLSVTGSGSLNLSKLMNIGFVQEVVAEAEAIKRLAPQTDVAIELGGEDAKIIYFTGGLEERMNGVCAGGTGSFIDQMAALLQTDAQGLNEYAKGYNQIYPIAARCGVFAKSDIQPLINDGATKEDLAASIFQAVVNQTISGLACGKPIRRTVAFLGGPLHFLTELKSAFIRTLKLTENTTVDPENSHLFPAIGTAFMSESSTEKALSDIIADLENAGEMTFELKRLDPLFESEEEYKAFANRHAENKVKRGDLSTYKGGCYLGIDAGSTTTKLALIGESGELLWDFYSSNNTSPINTAKIALKELSKKFPNTAVIKGACSTGYGESLLKAALRLDFGEVETIAHYTGARFFDQNVECMLDIGGQDMKFIKIKNGSVDSVLLNEACSSGCGSFLENFAVSMGKSAQEFSKTALFAPHPLDLGTRCTVFMNSNVKQAQKEGATLSDISAGLAYSVVKNALFKVIKLSSANDLGKHIMVQGGTFSSEAVLRAFEKLTGKNALCPDISGLMGAFGAALIAKERSVGESTILSFDEIEDLKYKTTAIRCGKCQNNCLLTVNTFRGKERHISGNRCERPLGNSSENKKGFDMTEYKKERMFSLTPLSEDKAKRGVIGIPRVLNIYENYPYWARLFKELGFRVVLSPYSSREIYEMGMESIPSESLCYPAKLAHGHIEWLIKNGCNRIFYPSVYFERPEEGAKNKYNCPIVIGTPENINNNVENITSGKAQFIHPFVAFSDEKTLTDRVAKVFSETFGIKPAETKKASKKAWQELMKAKADIREKGAEIIRKTEAEKGNMIVLASRPYHCDPEINHGIPQMIASYGFNVLTEDSIPEDVKVERPLRVTDQWSYHSRLYRAAEFVRHRDDAELLQLNSFGCGLDAVTTDQIAEILEASGKLYTVLKIDEVNNLGGARIRIRSLMAAIAERDRNNVKHKETSTAYHRAIFTEKMRDERYTIIAPQMAPMHFELVQAVFRAYNYNFVILDNDNRSAVDMGLKCVNNDACYPSLIMVGQLLSAVKSGKYDTSKLAILMTQTGGCCRATNYIGFIRRALEREGLGHIPVISLNLSKLESNPGFKLTVPMMIRGGAGLVYGDLIMKCLYRTRPYEKEKGSADALKRKWLDICAEQVKNKHFSVYTYINTCKAIVKDFDNLPLTDEKKPRVGIVGEILVKYMPLANGNLVERLEEEGAEAVVPDFLDFFIYSGYGRGFRHKNLGGKLSSKIGGAALGKMLNFVRLPAAKALKKSKRFEPSTPMKELAKTASRFISIGNQYGEGWFLTAEMVHFIENGVPNIVCIQPFGCLPNHIVGKGVLKAVRSALPQANIATVDYDPGASEVNQLNRIKLMLTEAKNKIK